MKKFLVVSDTHVPVYQKDLPAKIYELTKELDGVIAVGDFVNLDTVLTLETLSKGFHGVHGNMDHIDVKEHLPERKVIRVEGVNIGLIHGFGAPFAIRERIYKKFLDVEDLDVIIYGHTHEPFDGMERNIRFLNPGSATPGGTYAILTLDGGKVIFQIHRL